MIKTSYRHLVGMGLAALAVGILACAVVFWHPRRHPDGPLSILASGEVPAADAKVALDTLTRLTDAPFADEGHGDYGGLIRDQHLNEARLHVSGFGGVDADKAVLLWFRGFKPRSLIYHAQNGWLEAVCAEDTRDAIHFVTIAKPDAACADNVVLSPNHSPASLPIQK